MIKSLVAVFLAAILTENYILSKFLGICPFLGVSKKIGTAVGMSLAVTVVMLIATAVTYPLYVLVLVPLGLSYLQTLAFILVIAALVQMV
jgi:electron transport complex protein RnfA